MSGEVLRTKIEKILENQPKLLISGNWTDQSEPEIEAKKINRVPDGPPVELGWEIRVKLLVKLNTSLKKSGKTGNMLKTQVESQMGLAVELGWEIRVKLLVKLKIIRFTGNMLKQTDWVPGSLPVEVGLGIEP